VAAVAGGFALGSRFAVFRVFFAWPNGGTWANTVAAVEDGSLGAFFLWYLRDVLGPSLARWWARHAGDHHETHHDTTRKHVSDELLSLERRLGERLDQIEQTVRGAGGD